MQTLIRSLALCAAFAAGAAQAQAPAVTVEGAWARASVQGQSGTGAFMKITAPQALQLVGASTPAAGVAEVHEMKMEGEVMKMRPITALELPAGKAVELRPGGHHLMLMDLKAPLRPGTSVPVTLLFKNAAGASVSQVVQVPVDVRAPVAAAHKH